MMTTTMKVEPHSNVIYTPLENNEAVLLHLDSNEYFTLNETGNFIWQGIVAEQTMHDIGQSLEAAYDVSTAEAESCVQELVAALAEEGLVHSFAAEPA